MSGGVFGGLFGLGGVKPDERPDDEPTLGDYLGRTAADPRPTFGLAAIMSGYAPEDCKPPVTPGIQAVVDALISRQKKPRGRPKLNGRMSIDEKRAYAVVTMNERSAKPKSVRYWITEIQKAERAEGTSDRTRLFPDTVSLGRLEQSVSSGKRGVARRKIVRSLASILSKKSV